VECKNCQTELQEQDDYCPSCGGKVILNRLTFKNLFEHINETFLNYDNALFLTFIHLLKKPENVITSFVSGVRKRYVNPINFFALSVTISGISIFFIKKFYLQHFDIVAIFSDMEMFSNNASKKMLENYSSGSALEYGSLILSAIIPLFAIISWIVFYNKKYNLTEHIVLYLYSVSLYSICSVIFGHLILLFIPHHYIAFAFLSYPILLLYHCYLLKRLFKLSLSELILKTFLFLVIFTAVYIGFGILSFIISLATGSVNLQDFTPK
jgi:hypothetical protein